MKTITYPDLQNDLESTFDDVIKNNIPTIVTLESGKRVIMLSSAYFPSEKETFYLKSSAKNAQRLNKAIRSLEAKDK